MKFKFNVGDFSGIYLDDFGKVRDLLAIGFATADRANEILSKRLTTLPVVYGIHRNIWGGFSESKGTATHKAILFNVEELAKKECEHQPSEGVFLDQIHPIRTYFTKCEKCNVRLNAKWSVE